MGLSTVTNRIAIIGLGDLGCRIASELASFGCNDEILLLGRNRHRGQHLEQKLCAMARRVAARFIECDAQSAPALMDIFAREQPTLIVQCAALLSPWALHERRDRLAQTLLDAGFAIQLPLQLVVLQAVMRAACASGRLIKVVNCSYPDLTHAALRSEYLEPLVGIGNAGMFHEIAETCARPLAGNRPIRVIAHHSQVPLLCKVYEPRHGELEPRVFFGDDEVEYARVFAGSEPLPKSRELNALTCAHAVKVIGALLGRAPPLRTSVPGPHGRPGGWPALISHETVELDLPAGVTVDSVTQFNAAAARADGVEHIEPDGTVHFTERARAATEPWSKLIAQPLNPRDLECRSRALLDLVNAYATRTPMEIA
jgi:hypothetical protein